MREPLKYPQDVVVEFLKREQESWRQSEEISYLLSSAEHGEPRYQPKAWNPEIDDRTLLLLVETMLFASMATEEGHIQPVGVAFAEKRERFEEQKQPWTLVELRSPRPFDVRTVTKLASICEFARSFLAVVPVDGELKIIGVGTPGRATFFLRQDGLVRVMTPRPGTIFIFKGRREIIRYERGIIHPSPPGYLDEHHPQMTSVAEAVCKSHHLKKLNPSGAESLFFEELSRVISKMIQVGHGGILAVLGPEDRAEPLLHKSYALALPIEYGGAIGESLQTNKDREILAIPSWTEPKTTTPSDPIERLRQELVRFTTIDGAVLLSHSLQVLGFGVKLSITPQDTDRPLPKVRTISLNGTPGPEWALESRGARHRAAATFAQHHPDGFAFIVSQDGDAAVFQSQGEYIAHWPLQIPAGDVL